MILGKNRNVCGISIEKVEEQRSHERCRCRLEDNAKVNLEKLDMRRGCELDSCNLISVLFC